MQEFDLLVIGAGSGGVRAARFAADFGAKVAIAESSKLGGTCVNAGCIPKKILMYAANTNKDFKLSSSYGFNSSYSFDWSTLIKNKDREISRLNKIYHNLLTSSGVTIFNGHARLLNSNTVQIDDVKVKTKYILLAPGGKPFVPVIIGGEHAITSDELFHLEKLPANISIIGGGYIAVEFAAILQALGAKVTLIHRDNLFLRGFDSSLRQHLKDEFSQQGIKLKFNSEVISITKNNRFNLQLNNGEDHCTDCVLYATGRKPNINNLGLKNVGINLDKRGFIAVNDNYQTNIANIFAIGDAIGKIQLTPVALAEAMAVTKYLFKPDIYQKLDYDNIPYAVFSSPNLASVGLTEENARNQGFKLKVFSSKFRPLKLTLSDEQRFSMVKIIVCKNSDKVLGIHVASSDAGEIVQGFAAAIKAGITKKTLDNTIGIHPTLAEELVTMRNPVLIDA